MPNGKICLALKFEPYLSRRPSAEPESLKERADSLQTASPVAVAVQGRSSSLQTPTHLTGLAKTDRSASIMSVGGSSIVAGMGKLHIEIKSAKGLLSMDTNGDTNPFVRCYLLPTITQSGKRKTVAVPKTLDPEWNEEFVYKYQHCETLETEKVLEVTVWDRDRRGTHGFMGCIRLGPKPSADDEGWMDSSGEEVTHWEEMLANQDEWVERWHVLRPSSKPLRGGKRESGDIEENESDNGSEISGISDGQVYNNSYTL